MSELNANSVVPDQTPHLYQVDYYLNSFDNSSSSRRGVYLDFFFFIFKVNALWKFMYLKGNAI